MQTSEKLHSNRSWMVGFSPMAYQHAETTQLTPGRHGDEILLYGRPGAGTAKIVTVAGAGGVLQKRVAVPDMTATYCLPAT